MLEKRTRYAAIKKPLKRSITVHGKHLVLTLTNDSISIRPFRARSGKEVRRNLSSVLHDAFGYEFVLSQLDLPGMQSTEAVPVNQ